MRFRRSRQEEVQVNLTPLIDVVFLLLIFFMVSTTFTRETQLQIDLPESSSEAVLGEDRPIEIQVNSQGQYAVNNTPLLRSDTESLKQALAPNAEASDRVLSILLISTSSSVGPCHCGQGSVVQSDAVTPLVNGKYLLTM